MIEKQVPRLYTIARNMIDFFYPRYEIIGMENIPDEPCLYVANHAQIHGPLVSELKFHVPHYSWCIAEMMDVKLTPDYAFEDFWSKKPAKTHWFYKLLARIIAPPFSFLAKHSHSIAVYHDHRVRGTFRETVDVLQSGGSVLIFPECYDEYNSIVYQFQRGFVDAARIYHLKTGKEIDFVPVYIAPALRKMVIGKPVRYCAENDAPTERERICNHLMEDITALAKALPRHKVVPYPNIKKRNYPTNI